MSVKIRLKRMGKRNTPFYRLVVVDSRWRRDGKTIQDIGWYDPVKQPAQMSLKEIDIYQWMEKGVQLSETVRSLLKKQGIIERFRNGSYKEIMASGVVPSATAQPEPQAAPAPEVTVETPKVEAPKAAAPKVETRKVEEPKIEDPHHVPLSKAPVNDDDDDFDDDDDD